MGSNSNADTYILLSQPWQALNVVDTRKITTSLSCPITTKAFGSTCLKMTDCGTCHQIAFVTQPQAHPNSNILWAFLQRRHHYGIIYLDTIVSNFSNFNYVATPIMYITLRQRLTHWWLPSVFTCSDQSYISRDYVLDDEKDCLSGRDELQSYFPCLSSNAKNKTTDCEDKYFKCQPNVYCKA